jgi:hypothetical protein
MAGANHLYKSLIEVTNTYLGPAAPRFIDRHVRGHLKKDPENIQEEDMKQLVSWLCTAMNMLTKDSALVKQYTKSLKELVDN